MRKHLMHQVTGDKEDFHLLGHLREVKKRRNVSKRRLSAAQRPITHSRFLHEKWVNSHFVVSQLDLALANFFLSPKINGSMNGKRFNDD